MRDRILYMQQCLEAVHERFTAGFPGLWSVTTMTQRRHDSPTASLTAIPAYMCSFVFSVAYSCMHVPHCKAKRGEIFEHWPCVNLEFL